MITPEQVDLVQQSWRKVLPDKERTSQLFYDRLFQLDPQLRSLFRGDLADQRMKLMAMINTIVRGLHALDDYLLATLSMMGTRHAEYGVLETDYKTIGSALLWALEKTLGDEFTEEVREAWSAAYQVVADTMRNPLLAPAAAARATRPMPDASRVPR